MPLPVLLDTDTGVDDALALILALRSPELSVKAITTVGGNVEVRHCTRNVLRILETMGLSDKPLVAQGEGKPLRRKLFTAPEVHGKDGLGNSGRWSPARRSNVGDAVDTILTLCDKFSGKLVIIALGPLTNIARAWLKKPATLMKVKRIITMGGAFRVPGNTGPVSEFNYYVDPEAAHQLLNSGLPITLVPLDLTQQIVLMKSELEYRARRRSNRLSRFVLRFMRLYMRYHRKTEGFLGAFLHDPITVSVAIDPGLFRTQRVFVQVETKSDLTRGMTIGDFRKKSGARGAAVQVALRMDKERFLKLFHERLWS